MWTTGRCTASSFSIQLFFKISQAGRIRAGAARILPVYGMDQLTKTGLTGIAGTTVMTAGSELMSLLFKENFREADHLETMISRLVPQLSKQAKKIAGWGAHYAMGIVFAAVYVELWETKKIRHNLKNGLILGALSGVLGFLIWKATFKAHPLPPWINYDHYYLQRIPAHIIFAVAATLAYRLMPKIETSGL